MEIFGGAEGDWKDWYFYLGGQVKGAKKDVADVMGLVENMCFKEGDLDVGSIKSELEFDNGKGCGWFRRRIVCEAL